MSLFSFCLTISMLMAVGWSLTCKLTEDKNCYDSQGCKDDDIVCYDVVRCDGYEGCRSANVSKNYHVQCDGRLGCQDTTMNDNYVIDCGGSYGCYKATITASTEDDSTRCDGRHGCQDATIVSGGRAIYARGLSAGWQAKFTDSLYYYFDGAYSLIYGLVDSGSSSEAYIYLDGFSSAQAATIVCRKNSFCDIECSENSDCTSANITCFGDVYSSNCQCDSYCPDINYVSDDNQFDQIVENWESITLQRRKNYQRKKNEFEILYPNSKRIAKEKLERWMYKEAGIDYDNAELFDNSNSKRSSSSKIINNNSKRVSHLNFGFIEIISIGFIIALVVFCLGLFFGAKLFNSNNKYQVIPN